MMPPINQIPSSDTGLEPYELLICPCKATHIRFSGTPLFCGYCHCSDCRTSGCFAVGYFVEYDQKDVCVEKGSTMVCDFRPTRRNHSCSQCGKFLFSRNNRFNVMTSAMNFLDAETAAPKKRFAPQAHMWYGKRVLDIQDKLPKYLDLAPALGGTGREYYLRGIRSSRVTEPRPRIRKTVLTSDDEGNRKCLSTEIELSAVQQHKPKQVERYSQLDQDQVTVQVDHSKPEVLQVQYDQTDTANEIVNCPCGKTTIVFEGDPILSGYCHCLNCREAIGLAVHHFVAYNKDKLSLARGALFQCRFRDTRIDSSCQHCGKFMFFLNKFDRYVTSGMLFVNPNTGKLNKKFVPRIHAFYSERLVDVKDDLVKFLNVPQALGGDGELYVEDSCCEE